MTKTFDDPIRYLWTQQSQENTTALALLLQTVAQSGRLERHDDQTKGRGFHSWLEPIRSKSFRRENFYDLSMIYAIFATTLYNEDEDFHE